MYKLDKHQTEGLKFALSSNGYFGLFWKMRIQKSLVITRYLRITNLFPALILAPVDATFEWIEQFKNEIADTDIVLLNGSANQRLKKLVAFDKKVYIINHEGYRAIPEIVDYAFKCVVLDESHCIKNNTKFAKFMTKNFRDCSSRIILSGTWAPETSLDLYNQLKFLHDDYTLPYKDFWQFKNSCFDIVKYKPVIRPNGLTWISKLLNKYCHQLDYTDIGVNDTINTCVEIVKMSKVNYTTYQDMFLKFILEDDYVQKSTAFGTKRYVWMRYLLSGFIEDRFINPVKLNRLKTIIYSKYLNEPIIIWSVFNLTIEHLAKTFDCPLINGKISPAKRKEIKRQFQNGEITKIVANPACFTHGANLSQGVAQFYYDMPESGLKFNQSMRRIFSIRQQVEKNCYLFITEGTIEETIMQAHLSKSSVSTMIYNLCKDIKRLLKRKKTKL